jgi:biopolymer transport protein ExbB/TolQ
VSVYVEIVNVLFVFSTALLYPVILALLLLFGWSLALLGTLISEYTSRRRDLSELERACREASEMARMGREDQACSALEGYKAPPTGLGGLEGGGLFPQKRRLRAEA